MDQTFWNCHRLGRWPSPVLLVLHLCRHTIQACVKSLSKKLCAYFIESQEFPQLPACGFPHRLPGEWSLCTDELWPGGCSSISSVLSVHLICYLLVLSVRTPPSSSSSLTIVDSVSFYLVLTFSAFSKLNLMEFSLLEWDLLQARDENSFWCLEDNFPASEDKERDCFMVWLPLTALSVLDHGTEREDHHHFLFTVIPLIIVIDWWVNWCGFHSWPKDPQKALPLLGL